MKWFPYSQHFFREYEGPIFLCLQGDFIKKISLGTKLAIILSVMKFSHLSEESDVLECFRKFSDNERYSCGTCQQYNERETIFRDRLANALLVVRGSPCPRHRNRWKRSLPLDDQENASTLHSFQNNLLANLAAADITSLLFCCFSVAPMLTSFQTDSPELFSVFFRRLQHSPHGHYCLYIHTHDPSVITQLQDPCGCYKLRRKTFHTL